MAGMIAEMFHRVMVRQSRFFDKFPKEMQEKLTLINGRYAELTITGQEGGKFYFHYADRELVEFSEPSRIPKNKLDKFKIVGDKENYPGGDEVLFDVIDGDLSPRVAISRRYFQVNTERVIYDTEEFVQAFEKLLIEMRRMLGPGLRKVL